MIPVHYYWTQVFTQPVYDLFSSSAIMKMRNLPILSPKPMGVVLNSYYATNHTTKYRIIRTLSPQGTYKSIGYWHRTWVNFLNFCFEWAIIQISFYFYFHQRKRLTLLLADMEWQVTLERKATGNLWHFVFSSKHINTLNHRRVNNFINLKIPRHFG